MKLTEDINPFMTEAVIIQKPLSYIHFTKIPFHRFLQSVTVLPPSNSVFSCKCLVLVFNITDNTTRGVSANHAITQSCKMDLLQQIANVKKNSVPDARTPDKLVCIHLLKLNFFFSVAGVLFKSRGIINNRMRSSRTMFLCSFHKSTRTFY